jgi:hypothetical protein
MMMMNFKIIIWAQKSSLMVLEGWLDLQLLWTRNTAGSINCLKASISYGHVISFQNINCLKATISSYQDIWKRHHWLEHIFELKKDSKREWTHHKQSIIAYLYFRIYYFISLVCSLFLFFFFYFKFILFYFILQHLVYWKLKFIIYCGLLYKLIGLITHVMG